MDPGKAWPRWLVAAILWTALAAQASDVRIQDEYSALIRRGKEISALGADLFGDTVNLYTGAVEFVQHDIELPGNFALPVGVGRRFTSGRGDAWGGGYFGDWDLEIPRIHGVFSLDGGWTVNGSPASARCSRFGEPPIVHGIGGPSGGAFSGIEYWQGTMLYLPGRGDEEILLRNPATPVPSDGRDYPLVTRGGAAISCLEITDGTAKGEGFEVVTQDGTHYRFDHMVTRFFPNLQKTSPIPDAGVQQQPAGPSVAEFYVLLRQEMWLLPSQITDRFGNWVRYDWNAAAKTPWQLAAIRASDGRSLTFAYGSSGGRQLVTSVSDGTRVFRYSYTGGGLTGVQLPDGSNWSFSMQRLATSQVISVEGTCDSPGAAMSGDATGSMTHPGGATGTFAVGTVLRGRSWVERRCGGPATQPEQYALTPSAYISQALTTRTISGPGLPAAGLSWRYAYGAANACWDPSGLNVPAAFRCTASSPTTVATTVTDPESVTTRYTFGNRYRVDEGQLQKVEDDVSGASAYRVTSTTYASPAGNAWPDPVGYSSQPRGDSDLGTRHTPLRLRSVAQDGASFTWEALSFDGFARPVRVVRSSSLGYSRGETTAYFDLPSRWVMGQVASLSNTNSGEMISQTVFDPVRGLPQSSYAFGRLLGSYSFRVDGTLETVSDAGGNAISYRDFHRGLARQVQFPPTPESPSGASESIAVDDIGRIRSYTNAAGTTTGYDYDPMGRLTRVTPPAGDDVAWNATTYEFARSSAASMGLAAGHWQRVEATGTARTVTWYDALWRPVLSKTWDSANEAGTRRMLQRRYDSAGRLLFASYPLRSISSVDALVPGSSNTYDPIGRVRSTAVDSELGTLSTRVDYLAGFVRRTTDARGFVDEVGWWALDEPADALPMTVRRAVGRSESTVTTFTRDAYGKPTSIARSGRDPESGATVSLTRRYVYDARQRLCKALDPESGVKVQDYDAVGRVAWVAEGLALNSLTDCQRTSVLANQKVAYDYDARHRLTQVTYGDGSPGVERGYTADGLDARVASDGSTWTLNYNRRRLPTVQALTLDGARYPLERRYDANGHVRQWIYPDNAVVDLAPNGLGESTRVGSYATGVTTHPNGAVAGFSYGNGLSHSLTQNLRGLPERSTDTGVLDETTGYDESGNVASVVDSLGGLGTRWMTYDGLDRLATVDAVNKYGTASYRYDGLDNLRRSTFASGYDLVGEYAAATGRLSCLRLPGSSGCGSAIVGYGYNDRGDVTQRAVQGTVAQVFSVDQAHRVRSVSGGASASYRYDGYGHRVARIRGGTMTVQVYDPNGVLRYEAPWGNPGAGTRYAYLNRHLLGKTQAGATTYFHTDALGSPRKETDASAQVVDERRYTAYGWYSNAPTVQEGPDFAGHVRDADTGLSYMLARYYDPFAGRFLGVDPVAVDAVTAENFNRYWYANNNPYKNVDPDGRDSASCYGDGGCGGNNSFYPREGTLGTIADFTPVVGDIKGFVDAYNEPSLVNVTAAVVGLVPVIGDAAGKTLKTGSHIFEAVARGRKSEARVLSDMGEAKNTSVVSTSQGRTIPDFQNPTQVGEIKDTARVSDSSQLRAQREHAQATGREHVVVTGSSTQVSGTVQSQSTVIRRDDLGPGSR